MARGLDYNDFGGGAARGLPAVKHARRAVAGEYVNAWRAGGSGDVLARRIVTNVEIALRNQRRKHADAPVPDQQSCVEHLVRQCLGQGVFRKLDYSCRPASTFNHQVGAAYFVRARALVEDDGRALLNQLGDKRWLEVIADALGRVVADTEINGDDGPRARLP